MTKNTRNRLIAAALFVAILSPLYAFSVVGLPLVAAAALIFTGLFVFDWFRTQKATSKPSDPILDANLKSPLSPEGEKDTAVKAQVTPAVTLTTTPIVTPDPKPSPGVASPQVEQPAVVELAAVPTVAELTNKLSALQKSIEEGRHIIMQFAILQALKPREGKLNPDFYRQICKFSEI